MPGNPKLFVHGTLIELSSRTEQGLPFAATPFVRLLWLSILARAQTYYPVKICHAVLMANHFHLLVIVLNPEDVPNFMEYIKRETAHAVKHLCGQDGCTVWEEEYCSAVILDPQKAVERIGYCYGNPSKAHLVRRIDDYPNWSTWEAFINGGSAITVPRIPRDHIPELPLAPLSLKEQEELAQQLEENGLEPYLLTIEPDAWMSCFTELEGADTRKINESVLEEVRRREAQHEKDRQGDVLGAHALRLQCLRKEYKPTTRGKKITAMSSIIDRRRAFITWFREQVVALRDAQELCSPQMWLAARPPGFFMPGGRLVANLNPCFVPLC